MGSEKRWSVQDCRKVGAAFPHLGWFSRVFGRAELPKPDGSCLGLARARGSQPTWSAPGAVWMARQRGERVEARRRGSGGLGGLLGSWRWSTWTAPGKPAWTAGSHADATSLPRRLSKKRLQIVMRIGWTASSNAASTAFAHRCRATIVGDEAHVFSARPSRPAPGRTSCAPARSCSGSPPGSRSPSVRGTASRYSC